MALTNVRIILVGLQEMERVKRLREQAAAAKAQAAYGADKSGLFAILPKPKAEQEIGESMYIYKPYVRYCDLIRSSA